MSKIERSCKNCVNNGTDVCIEHCDDHWMPCFKQKSEEETMNENTYKITIYYKDDVCSEHSNITEFFFTDGSKFFYICNSKGACEYISSEKILNIFIKPEDEDEQ